MDNTVFSSHYRFSHILLLHMCFLQMDPSRSNLDSFFLSNGKTHLCYHCFYSKGISSRHSQFTYGPNFLRSHRVWIMERMDFSIPFLLPLFFSKFSNSDYRFVSKLFLAFPYSHHMHLVLNLSRNQFSYFSYPAVRRVHHTLKLLLLNKLRINLRIGHAKDLPKTS
jgi:hypothetical protein